MAFSVFQSGSNLYGMNQRGSIVELALPTGVTIDPNSSLRTSVFGNFAVLVNSPSTALTVDANLNVRKLTPDAPTSAVTLTGASGGALSGTFEVRQTFVVNDAFGVIIGESDFGPTSASATISSQYLKAAGINISSDVVSLSRLYRTTDGTSVFFQWIDLNGNTQTSIQDDLSDAGLSIISAPALGTPPNLYLIAEFKSRLFGVGKDTPNTINYSEVSQQWAWPGDNTLGVPRLGSDNRGVTGFARRRDALGVGRANGLYQITGTSDTDLVFTNISENCGIEAPDSVVIWENIAYFLWKDGVYTWDDNGITCISDGKVRRWFTRNDTFNLDRLQYAFAHIDPFRHKYRLFLASSRNPIENCWVEYDIDTGKWWGPHFMQGMNPSAAFQFITDSGVSLPLIGGTDGFCRVERAFRVDDAASGTANIGINFEAVTSRIDMGQPDYEKYFGEMSVSTKPQPSGTLDVTTTVGDVDSMVASPVMPYDMTLDRQRLGRVGQGKAFKAKFSNAQPFEDVNLRGFEVEPVNILGKR